MILFVLPILTLSFGYYFYKNKYKIGIKLFNNSSKLKLCIKNNLFTKHNNFKLTSSILIHNNNIYSYNIDISSYFNINNYFNKNQKELNKETFSEIMKIYNIKKNKDTRILFNYIYDEKEYYLYWTGNNVSYNIKNFISNLKKYDSKIYSFFVIDMKSIKNIKTETFPNGSKNLRDLFRKLSGPLNDYGYLFRCIIKHKWIFKDFNLKDNKINIEQGCKINDKCELESFKYDLNNDDEILLFDNVEKLLL